MGGLSKKLHVIGRKGWGGEISECSGRPIFFLIKENWMCGMTRHHCRVKQYIIDKKSSYRL